MSPLCLSVLGGFECRSAGGKVVAFPTSKARALLAYLAVHRVRRHSREALAALLWGRRDARARANLRQTLTRLHRVLPRGTVSTDDGGLALGAGVIDVDATRFLRLVKRGTPADLERAGRLYRGPFLEGFPDCGPAFHEWLMEERAQLEGPLREALGRLLEHHLRTGAVDRALQVGRRLTLIDPLEEETYRTMMRLCLQQERAASALEHYRRCRETLARELGVEPSAETERLHRAILAALPPGGAEGLPPEHGEGAPGALPFVTIRPRRMVRETGRPSVAVLPFTAPTGDEGLASRGESLAEDLATELGRFSELDVVASAAAALYRQAAVPPHRVGRHLGAGHLLHGRLRVADGRIRIAVQLTETATARQVWAERYDCPTQEVLDVHDDIVARVAGTLVGQLERAHLERARNTRPEDWQTYDLWALGWSRLKRTDLAALEEARALFRRAAARDPGFARAYSGLALTLWAEWACYAWNPWVFPHREAIDLARRAVALDDRDHRAHGILGVAHLYAREYDIARRHLLRALELNPNDADVLAHAAFGLALIGDHDLAVRNGRRALRLHPHHPDWYAGLVGIALFSARLYEEAIVTMAPAPEAFCSVPAFVAAAYAHLGRVSAAAPYRERVHRHYQLRLQRRELPRGCSCVGWLLDVDPFRLPGDVQHYVDGLRKAGFEEAVGPA